MQFLKHIINSHISIEPSLTGTNVRGQISAWAKTHRVMPENPHFLENENCNDRRECQRYQIMSTRYTSDASMYEVAVVCIILYIAPVVREI